jgi:ribosome modulation factor
MILPVWPPRGQGRPARSHPVAGFGVSATSAHKAPETNSSKSVDSGENAGFSRVEPVDNAFRSIVGPVGPLVESPLSPSRPSLAQDLEKPQVEALIVSVRAISHRWMPHRRCHQRDRTERVFSRIHTAGLENRRRGRLRRPFSTGTRLVCVPIGAFRRQDSGLVHRCGKVCGYSRKTARWLVSWLMPEAESGQTLRHDRRSLRREGVWTALWTTMWIFRACGREGV